MEKYFAAAFGLLLGLIGLYACFTQLRNFASLDSWKIIKGKVTGRGTVESPTGNLRSPGIRYSPVVQYNYQIDEKNFSNDAIYPKHMMIASGSKEWAEIESKSFPDDVTIFYNPENPGDSCLKLPAKSAYYIIGIASVIVLLFSAFILVFGVDNWVGSFNSK
jgi:hypothetical protein